LVLTFLGLLMEATLSVFREVWAFGVEAQLKTLASRKLPLVACVQRGYHTGGSSVVTKKSLAG
jgi:hypothetical protein